MLGRSFTCWKVRAIPALAMRRCPARVMSCPRNDDLAVIAPERAGNQVEYRALAGTVRSDQPDDFAWP